MNTAQAVQKDAETRMQGALDALGREFAGVRTGRANAALLEHVRVDYYDTPTPLNQVASVSLPFSAVRNDIFARICAPPSGVGFTRRPTAVSASLTWDSTFSKPPLTKSCVSMCSRHYTPDARRNML